MYYECHIFLLIKLVKRKDSVSILLYNFCGYSVTLHKSSVQKKLY